MNKVEINKSDVQAVKSLLNGIKGGADTAIYRAINKGIAHGKTQAVKAIGQELNLKAARIKEDFIIEKAYKTKLFGAVIAVGEPIGLINFGARQFNQGTKVKVKKAKSPSMIKHAYIGTSRNGKHVFRRKRDGMPAAKKFKVGKKSQAAWPKMGKKYRGITGPFEPVRIERLTGPRIEDIYDEPRVYDPVFKLAADKVSETLMSEAENILARYR